MKFISILFFIILFSCSSDDQPDLKKEFLKEICGRYRLNKIYTKEPIDLNFDGVAKTDLMQEVECFTFLPFDIYAGEFTYNEDADYKSLWLTIPESNYINGVFINECMNDATIFFDFDVNGETKEIIVKTETGRDTSFEKFIKLSYDNKRAVYEFEKPFYTLNGWQNVIIYLEYVLEKD